MNIKDLKYLVALAEHGHFGNAANACFVSQPALSMQIKKLEEYLGVKLLERTNKSVLLTDDGIIIAERARQILNQVEEVREIAKSAKDPYSGELRIGVFPTLAPYLLPLIVPSLSKIYPKLSLYLFEEQTAVLIEKCCPTDHKYSYAYRGGYQESDKGGNHGFPHLFLHQLTRSIQMQNNKLLKKLCLNCVDSTGFSCRQYCVELDI